jgi:hypothetical protein
VALVIDQPSGLDSRHTSSVRGGSDKSSESIDGAPSISASLMTAAQCLPGRHASCPTKMAIPSEIPAVRFISGCGVRTSEGERRVAIRCRSNFIAASNESR